MSHYLCKYTLCEVRSVLVLEGGVLKGILIKHCYFCTRPRCQHSHHSPGFIVPLPEPSLSSNHSTGFGRNGWAGLPLAAGGEIGLPPPMRAGNPGAKRRINFQLIVDEWSRKGKQLQVGHDANSSNNGSHNVYKLHGANFSTFLHGPYWLVILLRICSNNWN